MLFEVLRDARLIGFEHQAREQRGLLAGAGDDTQDSRVDLRVAVEVVQQGGGEHQVDHLARHQLMLVMQARIAPVQVIAGHATLRQPVGERLPIWAPQVFAVERTHREIPHGLTQVVQQAGDPRGDPPARLDVVFLVGWAVVAEDVPRRALRGKPGHFQGVLQEPAGSPVVMHLAGRQQMHEGGEAPDDRTHQLLEDLGRTAHAVLQALDQLGLSGEDVLHAAGRKALARRRVGQGVVILREWRSWRRYGRLAATGATAAGPGEPKSRLSRNMGLMVPGPGALRLCAKRARTGLLPQTDVNARQRGGCANNSARYFSAARICARAWATSRTPRRILAKASSVSATKGRCQSSRTPRKAEAG